VSLAAQVQVTACAEPGDVPCQTFYGAMVPASQLKLQAVSGASQMTSMGQSFAPLVVQVTDSSTPPNNVLGASVVFQSVVMRPAYGVGGRQVGDTVITPEPMPVIVSSSQSTVISGSNGLASLQAATGVPFPAVVEGSASVGTSTLPYQLETVGTYSGEFRGERQQARFGGRGEE